MSDWSRDLDTALATGDPAMMKAMLARVPKQVLASAVPYVEAMAKNSVEEKNFDEALTYYDQLIETAPDNVEWHASRARVYVKLDRLAEALQDATRITELLPEDALGYRLQGEVHDGLREQAQAIAAYRQVLRLAPDDEPSKERIRFLEEEVRKDALLHQTLDTEAAGQTSKIEVPPPPEVTFDPALLEDPEIPAAFDDRIVAGLKALLRRYSGHQSQKNTLTRLDDPTWLAAWDQAFAAAAGSTVLMCGSELGTFALQALKRGATRVLAVEQFPFDGRISSGVVQKHFLTQWHAQHGASLLSRSEEERRESFDAFAHPIEIVPPDSDELERAHCDVLVFPNLDHSLLGTGIVKAIQQYRARGLGPSARILPARAKVFAMGIEWRYPSTSFQLHPINDFRWSCHPQALELSDESWRAVTEPVRIGEIDFENFAESTWNVQLPVIANGNVDAFVYWFELDLGETHISNAPGKALQCIRPAVQYADSLTVEQGESLPLSVRVSETRLHFRTEPPLSRLRSHGLPSWYIPMLLDKQRNDAYLGALHKALASDPNQAVLDIGSGCGLLSMMAAQAGATSVVACESNSAISRVGSETMRLNGLDSKIAVINKDCRSLKVPDDLPERADLAVFELFDCSLIGEGVLHFLAYAREHLLKEHARFLPMAAKIHAMVVEYRLDRIWEFDVNLLNPYRFSSAFVNVDARALRYRPLTEPVEVFSFDFSKATPAAEQRELKVPVLEDGIAGAMLFWFDLQLDETLWISNAPGVHTQTHWKQGLQFLPEIHVTPNLQLPLIARHDGSSLSFRWQQQELPEDAFSKLPRFDPRSIAAISELEQQTRSLLEHCMHNPDQYAKVAELAKRFAIDPAAHGLDPLIAQRFVATFFGM